MKYISAYSVEGESLVVRVTESNTGESKVIKGDNQIIKFASELNEQIIGLEVLKSTVLCATYNNELLKIYGLKEPTKVGIKFEYRNWEEVVYIPTRNETYEYTFRIGNKDRKLKREYLLMQKVKFDLTDKFRSLPRTDREYNSEEFLPDGFIPKPPAPTREELIAESNKRRIQQEREKQERERQLNEDKQRLKEENRQKALAERELTKKQDKEKALQRKARHIQNMLKNKSNKPETRANINIKPTPGIKPLKIGEGKKFRGITQQELDNRFEVVCVYKGFKVYRSKDSLEDLAIVCVKAKDIYAKTIKTYVHTNERIVTPFMTVSDLKRWINSEFY